MAVIVPTEPGSVDHDPVAKGFKLINDQAAPGANKVYGTDGSGIKGWKDDPTAGSSLNQASLSAGGVTALIRYTGASAPSFTNPGTGIYLITMAAGTTLRGAEVKGNNGHLTGTEFKLRLNDTDGKEYRFICDIINEGISQTADIHAGGNAPTQILTAAGEITGTFGNMNLYGVPGFRILVTIP